MRFVTKIRLSATVTALIVGPLLGTAVFYEARSLLQEHIAREQLQMARSVMREIDTAMSRAYSDISLIANDELLRDSLDLPPDDPARLLAANEFEERGRRTGPWEALAVFDASGRVVFSPKPLGRESNITAYKTSRSAFQQALKGEVYYSDKIVQIRTGRPIVIFAAPIHGRNDPHRVIGVVIGHFSWQPIQDMLNRVDSASMVHLVDSKGNLIGKRANDPTPLETHTHVSKTVELDKGTSYSIIVPPFLGKGEALAVEVEQDGFMGYQGSGWKLVVEQPLSVAFSPVRRMAGGIVLLVLMALLLLATLYSLLVRHFMAPLDSLVQGVRKVAEGSLDEKVTVRSKDEFGELGRDFNVMIDRLQERTRQLVEAQEELVRREKMAMLGQVAANVGNELRNPLGVMSNAVYYLQSKLTDADEGTKEYLDIIRSEIGGSERIVSDLLDAVSTRPPRAETIEVGELISRALEKCVVPPSVKLIQEIQENIPPLYVDASQMQRVIRNLVANAVDAMPEGGVLTIRAAASIQVATVGIRIQDTGIGIPPENMSKLFQPLFSTKSRGIGLGLLVSKNLVTANNGTISASSEVGVGTTFTIMLPAGIAQSPSPVWRAST